MVTLKQLDIATFDDTSSEDFDILLKEYAKHHVVSDDSKKRMQELVQAAIKDAKRYSKTGA